MQEQYGKQIQDLQGIHNQELEAKDKEISRLNTILEKAFNWFPLLKEMLRMEKLCYAIGFTKDMVNSLLTKKEAIRCNGKIYSEEHRRKFDIKNDIFKVEKSDVTYKTMAELDGQVSSQLMMLVGTGEGGLSQISLFGQDQDGAGAGLMG